MKPRDVEIIHHNGQVLVLCRREPVPLYLPQLAREMGYRVEALSSRLGLSERHLRRMFEEGIGIGPKDWMRQERMVAARSLLREGAPVKGVASELGFATHKSFSCEFQIFYGVSPSEFQRRELAQRLAEF